MELWRWIRGWLRLDAFADAELPGDMPPSGGEAGPEFIWVILPAKSSAEELGALEYEIQHRMEAGQVHLVMDMAAVDHPSSRLWGVMVAALQQARKAGGEIRIANMRDHVKRLFIMSGLSNIFTVHDGGINDTFMKD